MSGFQDLHPDRGGGPIDSDSVTTGQNYDLGDYPESGFIRCKKCGTILNTKRHPKGWEEGNTQASTLLDGAVTAGDATITVDSTTGFTTPATGSITAFATNGTGTTVTSAAHGLKGGKVLISSTTSYNGTFNISEIKTNSFVIPIAFVADDATGTWIVPEYFYIYDIGSYATDEDVSSTFTDVTNAPHMNKVLYTGITDPDFTGCSGAIAHDDNMIVKSERRATSGCPFCGTFEYQ